MALGTYDATREPLEAWLRTLELAIDQRLKGALFADDFTLHVPCIHISLKPKV